jgi:predicted alpha-1,6-mannanase (GH76 family)
MNSSVYVIILNMDENKSLYTTRPGYRQNNRLLISSQSLLQQHPTPVPSRRSRLNWFTAIFTLAIFILSLLLLHNHLNTNQAEVLVTYNYRSNADAGMRTLQDMYDADTGQWPDALWWQQANALETVVDYSSLTHSPAYLNDITTIFKNNNQHSFLNDYYDDEGWWAIAWIKAYDLTHKSVYLDTAKTIFQDMTGGWDSTCGGGLWWDKARTYKNAIPNELFLEVAIRLHERTPGDSVGGGGGPENISYIDWAMKEWSWFKQSGMLNSSHLVNDGLDATTCQNNNDPTWTYNQGVILGALTDLYYATHNTSYLAQAEVIADSNNRTNVDENGILYEATCEPDNSCSDDGPQFKGIYMKNLYYLYQADHKQAYRDFIMKNADAIWNFSRDDIDHLGLHWDGPFDQVQAHNQIPALDALNAAVPFSNLAFTSSSGILSTSIAGIPLRESDFVDERSTTTIAIGKQ